MLPKIEGNESRQPGAQTIQRFQSFKQNFKRTIMIILHEDP